MKKRLIAGLLVGAMAVSLLGCGASKTEEAPAAPAAGDSAAEETAEAEAPAETNAEPGNIKCICSCIHDRNPDLRFRRCIRRLLRM